MKIKREDIVLGGITPVAKGPYNVVIQKAEYKSAKDKTTGQDKPATLRVTAEIMSPKSCIHMGTEYATAGRMFQLMPQSIDPNEDYGLGRLLQALERSEFDFGKVEDDDGKVDTDLIPNALVGHKLCIELYSEEDFATRPATKQDIDNGQSKVYRGSPVVFLTDAEGKPLVTGHRVQGAWDKVLGPVVESLGESDSAY